MAARVFSQQLDRTKPLWELWLVQGLTRKRFALITKTHHALVDGVSGVDIATVLFDAQAGARARRARPRLGPETASPRARRWLAKGLEGVLATPRSAWRAAWSRRSSTRSRPCARSPRRSRASARSAGRSPTRRRRCR